LAGESIRFYLEKTDIKPSLFSAPRTSVGSRDTETVPPISLFKDEEGWVLVAHNCNLSYLGGID
jgi:hypothetical protein